jgi:signal transduction histidine kinase
MGPAEEFVLQEELQSLVRLLEPTADVRRVELRLSLASECLRLRLPLDEFRQILFNLLTNAIEASPESGEVIISAEKLLSGAIQIGIRDTGSGISEAVRPRLFEPFFRPASSE